MKSIGGREKIISVESCIMRLRLVLKDEVLVQDKAIKEPGAAGVMRLGQGSVHVFGTQSELLREEILRL